jgi:cell division protein FtsB
MFIIVMILVTAGLVAVAAYFSVVGIASIFAYNYVPALIMGIALEAGKISVAVYLYRYWRLVSREFKGILIVFLAALMFITSVGIFGYLSQGYQKTSEEFRILNLELDSLEQEYAQKKAREVEINRQIQQLPAEVITGRIRLAREFGDELAELRDRVSIIEPRIQALRVKRLSYESHIGPISYIAKMLDASQDRVVFYAILLLVFVIDPLAITLTLACNMALIHFWDYRRPRTRVAATDGSLDALVTRARSAAMRYNMGMMYAEAPPPEPPRAPAKKAAARRAEPRRAKRGRG